MSNYNYEDPMFWQGRTKEQIKRDYDLIKWYLIIFGIIFILAAVFA